MLLEITKSLSTFYQNSPYKETKNEIMLCYTLVWADLRYNKYQHQTINVENATKILNGEIDVMEFLNEKPSS